MNSLQQQPDISNDPDWNNPTEAKERRGNYHIFCSDKTVTNPRSIWQEETEVTENVSVGDASGVLTLAEEV